MALHHGVSKQAKKLDLRSDISSKLKQLAAYTDDVALILGTKRTSFNSGSLISGSLYK